VDKRPNRSDHSNNRIELCADAGTIIGAGAAELLTMTSGDLAETLLMVAKS
jgi:hypothetical protein